MYTINATPTETSRKKTGRLRFYLILFVSAFLLSYVPYILFKKESNEEFGNVGLTLFLFVPAVLITIGTAIRYEFKRAQGTHNNPRRQKKFAVIYFIILVSATTLINLLSRFIGYPLSALSSQILPALISTIKTILYEIPFILLLFGQYISAKNYPSKPSKFFIVNTFILILLGILFISNIPAILTNTKQENQFLNKKNIHFIPHQDTPYDFPLTES